MNTRRFLLTVLAGVTLALLGLVSWPSPVSAAPAVPVDIPLTQPDGTTFTARLWGDEFMHGMETLDGYTIIKNGEGYWVYAVAQNGSLSSAMRDGQALVVGSGEPGALEKHIRPESFTSALQPHAAGPQMMMGQNSGDQPLVFILVDFTNVHFKYTAAQFYQKAFGASGSIADFYRKASFYSSTPGTALNIVPVAESYATANDGIIQVTLPYAHPNDTDLSQTIAYDAMDMAKGYIDFASLDLDSDGYVTSTELHVVFIIAGYEESYCGSSCPGSKIWGHQWDLSSYIYSPLTANGKILLEPSADDDYGGYSMFGEIHGLGAYSDHIAQVGIMVHEIGHDLSWPDLYDIDYTSAGVGEWSVMGGGSWNMVSWEGDSPAMPDAFLKWYQGWLTPETAVNGIPYPLAQAETNAAALLLGSNPGGVDWDFTLNSGQGEYWLLENRQMVGYDAGLPGCGVLIWHIDETVTYSNSANADEDRPLVDLEQADGLRHLNRGDNRGDYGDAFPGSSGNVKFAYNTFPSSRYYNRTANGRVVDIQSTTCAASMSVEVSAQPLPSFSDYRYLPVIMNPLKLTGHVTYHGLPSSGKTVTVRAYNSVSGWSTYATATTDANGNYSITPPSLSNYLTFYVRWTNNASTTGYLSAWYCDYIYSEADNFTCDMEISDVAIASPGAGSAISLPYTFLWNLRGVGTDNYVVEIYDPNTSTFVFNGPLRGYKNYWTMNYFPVGLPINQWYWYGIWVYGNNGYGEPYYVYSVAFNNRGVLSVANDPEVSSRRYEERIPLPVRPDEDPAGPRSPLFE